MADQVDPSDTLARFEPRFMNRRARKAAQVCEQVKEATLRLLACVCVVQIQPAASAATLPAAVGAVCCCCSSSPVGANSSARRPESASSLARRTFSLQF